MHDPESVPRRALLAGLAAGTVLVPGLFASDRAVAGIPVPGAAPGTGGGGPTESRFLHFDDPVEEFRQHFRFERDLRDEGQAVSWYHFTVFAIPQGERPFALVRYEGLEYSYFRRLKDEIWRIHAHNVSFPRRIEDGSFADEIVNPLTGATVRPATILLLNDPGVLYGPRGYLVLDAPTPGWLPSKRLFRIDGDSVVVDHTRPKPATWPKEFVETSTSWVPRAIFDDPKVTSLPCGTSGFYLQPFPKWMGMGERRGHMIGAWAGRKLGSADELPVEFRERLRRVDPSLLGPRWSEFDRPLRFRI